MREASQSAANKHFLPPRERGKNMSILITQDVFANNQDFIYRVKIKPDFKYILSCYRIK